MLSSVPKGAGKKQIAIWKMMKPLTKELFLKYWKEVEEVKPMTDLDVATFETWENDFGGRCKGMRHKLSRNEHGISRVITSKGDIYEYTFKDGKGHGLQRWIYQH